MEGLSFGLSSVDFVTAVPELATIFPKLTYLILPSGQWKASDFSAVGGTWPKLTKLEFASTSQFDDDSFSQSGDLFTSLNEIFFTSTRISDAAVSGLSRLKKLSQLGLAKTPITDAALPGLGSIRSLKRLDLTGSAATAAGVASLKKERPDLEVIF